MIDRTDFVLVLLADLVGVYARGMSRLSHKLLPLILVGLIGGFFSGLFGVGGGIILVPLLILLLHFPPKLASGTSLAAILPTAIAGTISYATTSSINWLAGVLLGGGAVLGALLGSWLLQRIHQRMLRWIFIIFMVVIAIRMLFLVPDRAFDLTISPLIAVALVGVGLVVGVLSGLLGVGGGVIVVPTLMLAFGVGDLTAKGTSLLMMIPTSLTGTIANVRRFNVDLRAAAIIGGCAVLASAGGSAVAWILPSHLGSILFAILLLYSAAQLAWNTAREPRA